MYVKPATDGAKVPDPAMRGTPAYYLPPEGRDVEESDYWVRRVRDGDVVEIHIEMHEAPADGIVKTAVDGNELRSTDEPAAA
jgi:hypothetical protein